MKYKQGGDISVGDWVKHKETEYLGEVLALDSKCGLAFVSWDSGGRYGIHTDYTHPKSIIPAEPEELI